MKNLLHHLYSGELRTGTRVIRAEFVQYLEHIYQCPKLLQEWKLFCYITTPFLYYVVKF